MNNYFNRATSLDVAVSGALAGITSGSLISVGSAREYTSWQCTSVQV